MPNWCANSLVLHHEDVNMIERAVQSFQKEEFCNEFVPIPENEKENWYEWCISNWGTKWDVDADMVESKDDNSLSASFQSAWSPPVPFYEELEALGFSVRALYYEPGMAFAGWYEDGVDDFYEYGGMTSEQVANELPGLLDEAFGISEEIAQYEEAEQE